MTDEEAKTFMKNFKAFNLGLTCPECRKNWLHEKQFSWKCPYCGWFFKPNDKPDMDKMKKYYRSYQRRQE